MLGWRGLGECASRGQRVVDGRSWLWVKECFLEGNAELGVKNALFSVGLSASCIVYVGDIVSLLLYL